MPKIIVILISFILGIIMIFINKHIKREITYPDNVDSLQIIIKDLNIKNDSLLNVIDTTKSKIQIIEKIYEKELDSIINQPIANDVAFFTEYLSNATQ